MTETIEPTVTLTECINYLNSLVDCDKNAIHALVSNRVPCNQELADHPTCQVFTQNYGFHVGLLGIINGIFGVREIGGGYIAASFVDDEKSSYGKSLEKFIRTPK